MDLHEAEQVWRTSIDGPDPGNGARLADTALGRARAMERKVFRRDITEIAAAVFLSGVFLWQSRAMPTRWPLLLAALLALGVGAVFVADRIRWRRRLAGAPADVRSALRGALAFVDHQVRLLGSVWSWYLAPLALAATLAVAGVVWDGYRRMTPDVWARVRWPLMAAAALVAGVMTASFWFIGRLNHRTVEHTLRPHRDELAALLHELDEHD